MPRTIRYHLDEHCDPAIAAGLGLREIDATTTPGAGLRGARDEDHLTFGLHESRVVFTNDSDFLRHHSAGVPHAGIAYCAQGTRSLGEIIRGLMLIWEHLDPEDIRNQVEYL